MQFIFISSTTSSTYNWTNNVKGNKLQNITQNILEALTDWGIHITIFTILLFRNQFFVLIQLQGVWKM